MPKRDRLSGNEAIATAMRQIEPDVVAAFPITPSTEIPQYYAKYLADGLVKTEFVPVESEHSAMSACVGSQAAGARTMTATSSCGLALMHEILYIAASNRLPVTMAVVNRALSGPININADHSDSMGSRDTGWIQIYSENNQEAYDNFIQAVRLGEHRDVRLPVMVCQDGFITSHAVENIEIADDKAVKDFVGDYVPDNFLLDEKCAMSIGPYDIPAYYMEHKRLQAEGMRNAKRIALEIAGEFADMTGREYGLFEEYKLEDAEAAIVVINSAAGTAKDAVDRMRADGKKVGLLKIRFFRPFPAEEIADALKHVKAVAVMDRCDSFSNQGGPLNAEIRSALFGIYPAPKLVNYIYGIGGRDVRSENIEDVYRALFDMIESGQTGETYRYLSLRDKEDK